MHLPFGRDRADGRAPAAGRLLGLPVLVVELAAREALSRAKPDRVAYDNLLPLDGAVSIYAYTRAVGSRTPDAGFGIQARMFTPRMTEDPATGSATAATVALLAELQGSTDLSLRVGQGVDMGRPSRLLAGVREVDGVPTAYVVGDGEPAA